MNASKEEASKAVENLGKLSECLGPTIAGALSASEQGNLVVSIRQFLEAAKRKLPSEASYKKAKAKA